ncbi:MAG TPA: hypothetical protein PKM73_21050 [Verrucomicrobiota bacterium]|nr:hypothetical protein [Verrucomicrobiota bacterium]HNU50657.1 hypothetical protein [Verrucomicrobiota bacterium]
MIHLPGVLAAAGQVQRFCEERGWRFCFIGGVAVQRWGEPRLTQDLVVHKAFAGRDLNWGDVQRVLTRQHGKLNLVQIRAELQPLLELKDAPEFLDKLEGMLATVDRRLSPP